MPCGVDPLQLDGLEAMKRLALSTLAPATVVALDGPNFSGRTELLRWLTGLGNGDGPSPDYVASSGRPSAYIGPEVYNSLSGLAATAKAELQLHNAPGSERLIEELTEDLGVVRFQNRNPFQLSGGEQVLLAVSSGLALQPTTLAIDCALEQLEWTMKLRLLRWLQSARFGTTCVLLADNQLSECGRFEPTLSLRDPGARRRDHDLVFDPIRSELPTYIKPMRPCALSLKSLAFHYRQGGTVLRNASSELRPGQLYLLTGPNGSGKSTLAKLLSGVLRPRSGKLLVDELVYQPWTQPGQLVAYHFQNPDLQLFSTSVSAEIQAGPRALGLSPSEAARQADAAIAAFGLTHVRDEHPLDLPFVIRKRVAMAATLAMGRPWMILDEPTLGQDATSSEAIASLLTGLLSFGLGIVIISHSLWLRRRLSAQMLRIEGGILHDDGPYRDALAPDRS